VQAHPEVVKISALTVFPNYSVNVIPVESGTFFEFLGNLLYNSICEVVKTGGSMKKEALGRVLLTVRGLDLSEDVI
jgi:hypothetical protein